MSKPSIAGKSGLSRKKGVKKRKLPSLKSLRAKLDQVFSLYIRKRDADENGMGWCITCNRWALLECGHFIPRQHTATRWEPDNVWGQCARDNSWGHGEQAQYYVALCKKLGTARVVALMVLKHKTVHFTRDDLAAMIIKYS